MQNDYNIACKFTQSNIKAAEASQYLTWYTGNVITQCVSLGKFEEQLYLKCSGSLMPSLPKKIRWIAGFFNNELTLQLILHA